KESLLASVDVYVAPHTGGESFGIVLVEAMSGGAHVVASDIPAFRAVLDGGRYGSLFPNGDSAALAAALTASLVDRQATRPVREAAAVAVRRYDWSVVTREVLAVYETVTAGGGHVHEDPRSRTVVGRLRAVLDGRTEAERCGGTGGRSSSSSSAASWAGCCGSSPSGATGSTARCGAPGPRSSSSSPSGRPQHTSWPCPGRSTPSRRCCSPTSPSGPAPGPGESCRTDWRESPTSPNRRATSTARWWSPSCPARCAPCSSRAPTPSRRAR